MFSTDGANTDSGSANILLVLLRNKKILLYIFESTLQILLFFLPPSKDKSYSQKESINNTPLKTLRLNF